MTPTLSDVIAECERASEGSRELDARIHCLVTPGRITHPDLPSGYTMNDLLNPQRNFGLAQSEYITSSRGPAPAYTRSLDAAMMLVPEYTKRLYLEIDNGPGEGDAAHASIVPSAVDSAISFGHASTLPLALVIAALRARAILAKGETK